MARSVHVSLGYGFDLGTVFEDDARVRSTVLAGVDVGVAELVALDE